MLLMFYGLACDDLQCISQCGNGAGVMTRRFLAEHPMALQIGSTLFVHGGVLPMHAQYGLERINDESRAWMNGSLPRMPSYLGGRQAVVWARDYSAGMLLSI